MGVSTPQVQTSVTAEALNTRLDVRTPGDLVADAIAVLRTRQPEWVPRNASVEVMLLEALAELAGGIVSGADVILGATVEAMLSELYLVPRLPGASGAGNLTLTFDATTTTTIPEGAAFLLRDHGVELVATADVTVTSATSATVAVATAEPTSAANGLGSAEPIDVLIDVPNLTAVAISGTLSGGSDPETDEAYLGRARNRLARVTSGLIVPDHFTAYTLEDGRASNATTIGAWAGGEIFGSDWSTAGDEPGHVSVVAYGFGALLGSTVRDELAEAMEAMTAAGITVHCVNPDIQPVNVTTTVHPLPGWTSGDVADSVEAAILDYLNPETWLWGETVRTTSLITVIAAAGGVDYVTSMSAPAADVSLNGNQLASAGTITVTVT